MAYAIYPFLSGRYGKYQEQVSLYTMSCTQISNTYFVATLICLNSLLHKTNIIYGCSFYVLQIHYSPMVMSSCCLSTLFDSMSYDINLQEQEFTDEKAKGFGGIRNPYNDRHEDDHFFRRVCKKTAGLKIFLETKLLYEK